LNFLSFII
jgi:hypothetical protein